MAPKHQNIVFFHPDLGIGGAERLIIDAAVGLKTYGHNVVIFTSRCDKSHCFDEARDGLAGLGTLDVRVRGDWLFPASIFGRFRILLTVLRQFHLLTAIGLNGELTRLQPTIFFVDQLSANVPLMRWWWKETRIFFYCHFPDLLLVRGRTRWWKRAWRIGFDWLEGWGMRGADRIVVNSRYTKRVTEEVWEGLGGKRGVGIVYPCVSTREKGKEGSFYRGEGAKNLWKGKRMILSINRFEKKKDVGLAIKAFAGLSERDRENIRLVVAGGYDNQVEENVTYHRELVALAESLGLMCATTKNIVSALNIHTDFNVLFLLSVPAQLKSMLLYAAKLLVYTPSNEHFGIVPLEAMMAGVPVLAANNGGPLETVIDGETGWLRPVEEVTQWTNVMRQVLFEMEPEQLERMGEAGKRRVKEEFSETKMAHTLDAEIEAMVASPRQSLTKTSEVLLGTGIFGVSLIALCAVWFKVLQ